MRKLIAVLLSLILCFSFVVVAEEKEINELVIDGGFELGSMTSDTGWELIHSNTSIETNEVYNGSKSLRLGAWSDTGVNTDVNVNNGVEYELSFYHKGAAGAQTHIHNGWIGATGKSDVLDKQKVLKDDEFTKYTYTFTAKVTAKVSLYLCCNVAGTAYFDNVSLKAKQDDKLVLDYSEHQNRMAAYVSQDNYKTGEKVVVDFNLPENHFVPAGSVYYVTQNSGRIFKINKSNGEYCFYMPSEPVKVYADAFESGLNDNAVNTFGSSIKKASGTGKDAASGIQFGSLALNQINENGTVYTLNERGTILLRAKGVDTDSGITQQKWYDTLKNDGETSAIGYCKGLKLVSKTLQDETTDYIQYSARIYDIVEEEKEDYTFSAFAYAVYSAKGKEDILKFSDNMVYRRYTDGEIGESIIDGAVNEEFKISDTAKNYEDYINELYYASGALNATETEAGIKVVTDKMKGDIINAPDTIKVTGTTYYISSSGNLTNDGKSQSNPWSLAKLNSSYRSLKSGDAVLFKRGDTFTPADVDSYAFEAKKGVSYGAYGSGAKPVISGSLKNYANISYWTATDKANVYKCTTSFDNISSIVLNYSGEIGNSDELVASKKIVGFDGFETYNDMAEDLSYYCDSNKNALYFYCSEGNPGAVYDRIDIGGYHVLVKNEGAAIIENLSFVMGGYGIADEISSTAYMNVKGCTFGYIGGQMYSDKVVCGNAIETYGSVNGFYVENCWIYQVCDTAITHQDWTYTGQSIQQNIKISGNVIEYCFWGIEFNNPSATDGSTRKTENMEHSYNVISMTGFGFGKTKIPRVDQHATAYNIFGNAELINAKAEKNILNRSAGFLYFFTTEADKTISFVNNLNVHDDGRYLGYLDGTPNLFNEKSREYFEKLNELNSNSYICRKAEPVIQ